MKILTRLLKDKDHVIWDWNGTLLSDLDHSLAVLNRLLEEENLPRVELAHHRAHFTFPVVEYYRGLGFDCTPVAFADLCVRFNRHFHAGLTSCELWPGAREVLGDVKASGATQSLLSLTEEALLRDNVTHFRIGHLFDHVVGSQDLLAASKLERGRDLLARTAHPRERTVLIGDTDHDLEVGKNLGVDVILVGHGHQCPTRLSVLHDRVVDVWGS